MSEVIKGGRWLAGIGAAAVVLLTACAGPWQPVQEELKAPHWSIAAPRGWMHLRMPESEMLTKNGPYLEYMLIQTRPLTKRFRFTKQVLNPRMLPHEAAQLVIDNLRSDDRFHGFHLLASEPAVVDNRKGFQLIYRFTDMHGVTMKTVYYGFLLPDRFCTIRYTAAQRHYFEQGLPAFQTVLGSLQFSSTARS
jgi:hypothetical protein